MLFRKHFKQPLLHASRLLWLILLLSRRISFCQQLLVSILALQQHGNRRYYRQWWMHSFLFSHLIWLQTIFIYILLHNPWLISDILVSVLRYDADSIIGYRLYREIQKIEVKIKPKGKGRSTEPLISCQWETIATNLDEFLAVSVCSWKKLTFLWTFVQLFMRFTYCNLSNFYFSLFLPR